MTRSSPAASGSTGVGSTNDVVRAWLADGTPEVCLAVADEQTAGRGREGRAWVAPPGAGAAAVARVPADLAARPSAPGSWPRSPRSRWPRRPRSVAGLPDGHDPPQVAERPRRRGATAPGSRKLAGVLGETDGLGTRDPRRRRRASASTPTGAAADFPPELAADDDLAARGRRAIGRSTASASLDAFLDRLEARIGALRAGRFDAAGWTGAAGRRPAGSSASRRPTAPRTGPGDSASTPTAGALRRRGPGRGRRRAPGPRRRDHATSAWPTPIAARV